ncbi:unnamed protein product [Effrenium voratum]|nr:unnamed protein product [Effrenium voratum]
MSGLLVFLRDANVRLVRAQFLRELHQAGHAWPRRQEAETARTASGETALLSHDELEQKATQGPRAFSILSFSHCWEAKEHPDPLGYQLAMLVEALEAFPAEVTRRLNSPTPFLDPNWDAAVFIDYVSLHQFQRSEAEDSDPSARVEAGESTANHQQPFDASLDSLGLQQSTPCNRCNLERLPVIVLVECPQFDRKGGISWQRRFGHVASCRKTLNRLGRFQVAAAFGRGDLSKPFHFLSDLLQVAWSCHTSPGETHGQKKKKRWTSFGNHLFLQLCFFESWKGLWERVPAGQFLPEVA